MMNNIFFVILEQNTGRYLCDHKVYGTYPVIKRVVTGRDICVAKQFPTYAAAQKYLKSKVDFQDPIFNWDIKQMEAVFCG